MIKDEEALKRHIVESMIAIWKDPDNQWGELKIDIQALDVDKKKIFIKIGEEYESPKFKIAKIFKMVEYFQTEEIEYERFSKNGCETYDYGSEYGYEFIIELNIKIFDYVNQQV